MPMLGMIQLVSCKTVAIEGGRSTTHKSLPLSTFTDFRKSFKCSQVDDVFNF
jgi:hypothetical protein